jgi:hypothetical protein
VLNFNIDARIALWWCTAAHGLVVSSGDTDCTAGSTKAVLELRFYALVAGAIGFVGERSLSIQLMNSLLVGVCVDGRGVIITTRW